MTKIFPLVASWFQNEKVNFEPCRLLSDLCHTVHVNYSNYDNSFMCNK